MNNNIAILKPNNYQNEKTPFQLLISLELFQDILKYLETNKTIELGGFLLGHIEEDIITIKVFYPTKLATSTSASLHFTPMTWLDYDDFLLSKKSENLQTIGWIHTHPNLGVFLSRQDEQVNIVFDYIAIVYDPILKELGCFEIMTPKRSKVPLYITVTEENKKELSSLKFSNYTLIEPTKDEKK